MSEQEKYFIKIISVLEKYKNLVDCHLVDFFIDDLWNKFMPDDLKHYIEENGQIVINEFEIYNDLYQNENSQLQKFLKTISLLRLENCSGVCLRKDFMNRLNNVKIPFYQSPELEFMKVKKWHEVSIYTKAIVWLVEETPSIIIDAGAGKGYSSLHLSNYYNFPTIAIECSQINHKGAIAHQKLVNKKVKLSRSMINYVVEQINETTNFVQIATNYYPDLYSQSELALTALHACGSLTDFLIKSFLDVSDIKRLCLVPCCYHLASRSLSSIYEFSKNSRMLAQQSADRIKRKNEPLSPSLFYRAVLQVVLQSIGIKEARIGRGAPLDSFIMYAKWALTKLDLKELPSDEILEQIFDSYRSFEWKFQVFQLLRIELAPIVEAAIILDKIVFMQKRNICKKLELIQLFDPITSPRNWAIVATK
ncbi:probable methyltransferase-like protein 25 [Phymastichus coffea]|uniref:probable methyltransferase-like protein 25 n=1 Tax=Phymastichus coffea TaxID=108790 RepID=UPI00273CC80E|nr:probable methyltransferase-like protein 25 [Phymastichus coffea]